MTGPEDDQRPIVHVTKSKAAFAKPTFIVELEGRYYVSVAVLEYDPRAPDLTPEQREGVAQVQELFRSGAKTATGVVEIGRSLDEMPMNTGPVRR